MKLNRRYFGIYLAFLVALIRVTGASAAEDLWFPRADSGEELRVSDQHSLWASEEIFHLVKLPEYSENLFSGLSAIPPGHYQIHQPERGQLRQNFPQRDLKTHISSLLFPFHFFL